MSDIQDTLEKHASRRRDFLKKCGKIAVAAPAVAVLLQAGVKPAFAGGFGGGGGAINPGTTTTPVPTEITTSTTTTTTVTP